MLGEKRGWWGGEAVGRGVMRCGLWQTAQEWDRGSPPKVCLIAIALVTSSDPFQLPRAAWTWPWAVLPVPFSRRCYSIHFPRNEN